MSIPYIEDWLGNHVGIGDTVVYPRTSGRSVEMREAVVLEIIRHEEDRIVEAYYDKELKQYVRTYGPAYKFKLRPTGRSTRGFYAGEKDVWVQYGENVTLAPNSPKEINR